jgi:hypothetical protein
MFWSFLAGAAGIAVYFLMVRDAHLDELTRRAAKDEAAARAEQITS